VDSHALADPRAVTDPELLRELDSHPRPQDHIPADLCSECPEHKAPESRGNLQRVRDDEQLDDEPQHKHGSRSIPRFARSGRPRKVDYGNLLLVCHYPRLRSGSFTVRGSRCTRAHLPHP
jgi:hypothetical protein